MRFTVLCGSRHAGKVTYVDHLSREDLLRAADGVYGRASAVVETDVIDDGAGLGGFGDESLDFVIANHVLEHIEDPIAALSNWARVLRPDGVLFLTLPDASTRGSTLPAAHDGGARPARPCRRTAGVT